MQELESLDRIMADDPNMAVVWLHGLGANGHDFQNIPEHLNLPEGLRAHFCFPHAATQKVTINQGFAMPAWYDIYDFHYCRATASSSLDFLKVAPWPFIPCYIANITMPV